MATLKRSLSPKVTGDGKKEIIIFASKGRGMQWKIKSGFFISPERFNAKDGKITRPRNHKEAYELQQLEAELVNLEQFLIGYINKTPGEHITLGSIYEEIARRNHPELYKGAEPDGFFKTLETFIEKHRTPQGEELSKGRIARYNVLKRSLMRFELYMACTTKKGFKLTLENLDAELLGKYEHFMRHEADIALLYPEILEAAPTDNRKKPHAPISKGTNTIVSLFKALRAFLNWCTDNGLIEVNPAKGYHGAKTERYGTPYYITLQERDLIAGFDLSQSPALEAQRDIFIFQCYVGCRVGDLMRLTPANIIDNGVEYIPSKTSKDRADVVRVPLHSSAMEIIRKYAFKCGSKLLPFISAQKYNDAIKSIFEKCGIVRMVTVINPSTGKEEQRPLNEIASSHLARRTFVGNLYRQVKDPNLVGKLSGHKEGSRAFVRYRDIDEEMKRDLINLL